MPSISFIVARSVPGNVIGCDNRIPWHLRTDLRNFKKVTTNHVVIMGRKTFDSIGRPLPDRINIVISRQRSSNLGGVQVASGRESALYIADYYSIMNGWNDIFVAGGGLIYSEFEKLFNKIYLTEVCADRIMGDAFFKNRFDRRSWRLVEQEKYPASEMDEFPFVISVLEKKDKTPRFRALSDFMKPDERLESWEAEQLSRGKLILGGPLKAGTIKV